MINNITQIFKLRHKVWIPFVVAIVIFVLWSSYWLFAAGIMKQKVENKISEWQNLGYVIDLKPLKVSGFPYRFVLTLERLNITLPEAQANEQVFVEKALIHAMAWKPTHLIIELPSANNILISSQKELNYTAKKTRASLVFKNGQLSRFSTEIVAPKIAGTSSTTLYQASRIDAHFRFGSTNDSRKVFVTISQPLWPQMPLQPISEIKLNTEIFAWSALQGKQKLDNFRAANGSLLVDQFSLTSGISLASFSGKLQIDQRCFLSGKVKTRFVQPAKILSKLDKSSLSGDVVSTITAIGLLIGGVEETEMTFTLRKGGVYTGPFKIANAPRLLCGA
ncbi:MAG: DUF2125 domain-containing protein [Robiginitomaculum sp.]|nr:DUF2125 domain-containing protein [Robiginitomaculum sp.]